ncbi:MAG: PRC-barrel domain-containing protein [Nitrososphaerales archaeon]
MITSDITDKEVVGLDGWKIGKSKEVIFDRDNWKITHLDVQLKGNIEQELGMTSSPLQRNHLPVSVESVQGIGDVITLKTTKDELKRELTAYNITTRHESAGTANIGSTSTSPLVP